MDTRSKLSEKTDYNSPEEGIDVRTHFLKEARYTDEEIEKIEQIVMEINTWSRDESISPEAKALSDADMLFKCLPITPLLYSSKNIWQKQVNLSKILRKQW